MVMVVKNSPKHNHAIQSNIMSIIHAGVHIHQNRKENRIGKGIENRIEIGKEIEIGNRIEVWGGIEIGNRKGEENRIGKWKEK